MQTHKERKRDFSPANTYEDEEASPPRARCQELGVRLLFALAHNLSIRAGQQPLTENGVTLRGINPSSRCSAMGELHFISALCETHTTRPLIQACSTLIFYLFFSLLFQLHADKANYTLT
jgi:hypothetical protein